LTPVEHELGTVLDMELLLRAGSDPILCRQAVFRGRVVRCAPSAEGFEVGVEMVGLSAEDRELLCTHLRKLEGPDG